MFLILYIIFYSIYFNFSSQGMTFYNTPSVQPSITVLRDVIESAGGTMVTRRPSLRHIREYRDDTTGKPTFIVLTCDADLDLCGDLTKRQIGMLCF